MVLGCNKLYRTTSYSSNFDKTNLNNLFNDKCETCRTKYAVLKELAIENSYPQIRLMLGLFKMNKRNTPTISNIIFKSWFKYS